MMVSALIEVVQMQEPQITLFTKPITLDQRKEIGTVNFADYNYVLGTALMSVNQHIVPPEFGRIVAYQYENIGGEIHKVEISLVDCSDIVSQETMENTEPDIR